MIRYFKHSDNGLIELDAPASGCWINVIDPTSKEILWLQELGIPQDYIQYPLDLDERARSERENGETLILLRIPYFQGQGTDLPYITLPLGIILTSQYVVTICKLENDIINELSAGRAKGLSTGKRYRFVLRLLLSTATRYLTYLREINKVVDALEDQLQRSTRNKEVLELLKYQKSLTYFTTALKSNELLMERLQRSQLFRTYPEDEDLLEDVLTENQQAIEMTNIAANILNQMMDAFASIISNNLNEVMKLLTSITVVVAIPPIVYSFFGMNISLPLAGSSFASLYIIGISIAIALIFIFVFWKRDWF